MSHIINVNTSEVASGFRSLERDRRDMGSRDSEARRAGEIIYQSLSLSGDHISRSRMYQEPPPWDQQACCGIMSPVRRTFCLLVTFDLIFTFTLWGIYTQVLPKESTWDQFIHEVVHYTMRGSLFDVVLCAAWRFAPLELAYALFRIKNPSVIAVTTFGTCAFVLAKVFIFRFDSTHNNVLCYLLLITSFIIAWIEVWFLDFKVLPQERQFHRDQEILGIHPSERAPLLGGGRPQNYESQNYEYYSPNESKEQTPRDSDDEGSPRGFRSLPSSRGHSRNHSIGSGAASLGSQEQEYLQKAEEAWNKAWEIFHLKDGWKHETGDTMDKGIVYSKHFKHIGKLFKLEAYIDASKEFLFDELVMRCGKQPEWNSTVLECKCLQVINNSTDVFYTVAAEAAGGLVSSRDFVSLRIWKTKDDMILSAGCAVAHPDMPPTRKHVRGENRPGGWVFKSVPGNPDRSFFCWIINTDLKGWIPQYAVDQALSGTLVNFTKNVQKRIEHLKNNR